MRTHVFPILSLVALFVACTPTYEDGASAFVPPADSAAPAEDPEYADAEAQPEADASPQAVPSPEDLQEQAPEVAQAEGPLCERGKPLTKAYPLEGNGDDLSGGLLKTRVGDKWMALPLKETRFDTRVVGTVAETDVTQTFTNPYTDKPLEAIYVFPLADDAAVDDYWIHLGERHIHGVIKKREEARKMYEQAKQAGQSAALLDQERPNIFTQSVANIPPGGSIEVEMHVVQPLHQEAGRYELALPTVVGPRFIPGTPVSHKGSGRLPDTDQVPDASKITPPVLTNRVSCAELKVAVGIEGGLPVTGLKSKYHRIKSGPYGDQVHVELARDGELPNRDFVLSWSLAGARPQASLMAQRGDDGEGGYFTLTIQPPKTPPGDKERPRELIFVVDNSGSMGGTPIETAKKAITKSLDNLGPHDSFQVMRFSENASGMGPKLLANTPQNRQRAREYVAAMQGMGGTQMIEGIKASLGFPTSARKDAMRVVLFLTDGYIGNEVQIFEEIEKTLGETRLFSLGVGGGVNRYLLEGMARTGRGAVTYMGPGEKPDKVVNRFYERIAHPVLTDIELDWGSMTVGEVLPGKIPDLFHGQPVVVYGRYKGNPSGTIKLKGKFGDETYELPVKINFADANESEGLASMWARTKVEELEGYPYMRRHDQASRDKAKQAVTDLALEYSIMTKYTSFVAVDERKVKQADGSYRTVVQPVDLPAGVSADAVGEAYGTAGLGLVGTGRGGGGTGYGTIGLGNTGLIGKGGGGGSGSGYGRGSGTGFGGQGKRVPRVRQAKAQVSGALDKDIIRRIVRAHINEIRSCYNQGLAQDPNLSGRVNIEFTIGPNGKVLDAKVTASTLTNTTVEGCMEKALKRWKFPKPAGGGKVKVSYPFILQPG